MDVAQQLAETQFIIDIWGVKLIKEVVNKSSTVSGGGWPIASRV